MSTVIKIGKLNVIVNIWQTTVSPWPQPECFCRQSQTTDRTQDADLTFWCQSPAHCLSIICCKEVFFYNLKSENNSRLRFLVFQNGKHTNVTASSIMSVTRKWYSPKTWRCPTHIIEFHMFWYFILVIGFFIDATLLYALVLTLLSVRADTTVLREAYHLHFQTYCYKLMDWRSAMHQMKSWFSCRHGLILWRITLCFY